MLSLKELENCDDKLKVRSLTIQLNELINQCHIRRKDATKMFQEWKIEVDSLKHKLEFEVIPRVKTKVLEMLESLSKSSKIKITKTDTAERVHNDPEVFELRKTISIKEIQLEKYRFRMDDVEKEMEILKNTDYRLSSIGKIEGLLMKVKHGMAAVDVDGYFND